RWRRSFWHTRRRVHRQPDRPGRGPLTAMPPRKRRPPIDRLSMKLLGHTSNVDPYNVSIWEQVRRMNRDAIYSATAGALASLGINPNLYQDTIRAAASSAASEVADFIVSQNRAALTKENSR